MNRPVKVHMNLHTKVFSVTCRKSGKVIKGITDNITILNPVAKLGRGKYDDCHTKNKRHVCAWIIGEMTEKNPAFIGRKIRYNPFDNMHFTEAHTGHELPFNESLGSIAAFNLIDGKPVVIIGN